MTPFSRWLKKLNQRWSLGRIAGLFSVCLLLALVAFFELEELGEVEIGAIASSDFKSPINFEIVDEEATNEKRREAERSVPSIFDHDPSLINSVYTNVYKAFRTMRSEMHKAQWPLREDLREEALKEFMVHKPRFDEELGKVVSDYHFEWLAEREFSARVENVIIRGLVAWSVKKIVYVPANTLTTSDEVVLLRLIEKGRVIQENLIRAGDMKDLSKKEEFSLVGVRGFDLLPPRDQEIVEHFTRDLLIANVSFNGQETSLRRQRVRDGVLPVQLSVKKNQTIVSSGSVVRGVHLSLINEIRDRYAERKSEFNALAAALLFTILMLVLVSFLKKYSPHRWRLENKDFLVLACIAVVVVVVTKFFLFVTAGAFMDRFSEQIPSAFFLYFAPISAGAMLAGLLIPRGEIILVFTLSLAVILSVMVDRNFGYLLYCLAGGLASARGVISCKKRTDVYWAGLRTGLVNALLISLLMTIERPTDTHGFYVLLWLVPAGFFSGILSSMLVMVLVPILESVFNYTTDVKLLELSNLNHPLMKEMIVKAPGTYHHCMVVGGMCEAAAEEIGANALLAKVMAFYHDIGKTEHAQYFIENQRPGYNPHDSISPYMSKTILIAHVKDGAEMGMRHMLGKPIIDGILQHHGTTLISYFYNKALEMRGDQDDHVEVDDFRYPGPKPQFREAALVMLADSIEAAARSLDEPTPSRLQNIVKNIIQSKFLDGQLEECNLTLKDLSVIEACYKRVLLSMYHHRIDYPKASQTKGPSQVTKTRKMVFGGN